MSLQLLNEDFNKKQFMSLNITANVCNKHFMSLNITSYLYLLKIAFKYNSNALAKVKLLQAINCK